MMQSSKNSGYGGGREMPLQGYSLLLGLFTSAFALGLVATKNKESKKLSLSEFGLLALATHKISRIITKDWVTSPLRANFTRYEKSLGAGELKESSRGAEMQKAVGDLLTCPYCIGPWVASLLYFSKISAPKTSRVVTEIFAAVALSDFLHRFFEWARSSSANPPSVSRGIHRLGNAVTGDRRPRQSSPLQEVTGHSSFDYRARDHQP